MAFEVVDGRSMAVVVAAAAHLFYLVSCLVVELDGQTFSLDNLDWAELAAYGHVVVPLAAGAQVWADLPQEDSNNRDFV